MLSVGIALVPMLRAVSYPSPHGLRGGSYFLSYFLLICFIFNSSALVMAFRLLIAVFSPCRRLYFLLSEKKVSKETDTESLSDPIKSLILNVPFRTCIHALAETKPNVLFGFTKMSSLIGKAQRWRCRSALIIDFSLND